MASLYESLRDNTAYNLLTRFGTTLTLKKQVDGSYTPGGTIATTTTSYSVKGVILDYDERQREGGLVMAGDRKVIVSAKNLAYTPVQEDLITISGEDWKIISVKTLSPDGSTAIIHELQVRR